MGISIFKGILTGIILSLPFGPVGLYCTELTIVEGRWKGYITALGMVTIDVFYSSISMIFLSKVEHLIIKYEYKLSLFIGLFLMAIALRKLMIKPKVKHMEIEFKSMLQNYFTGVFFSLANITTILMITAIFTALKVYNDESPTHIYETIIGVFIGGASLCFLTTTKISYYGRKLENDKLVVAIKRVNMLLLVFSLILVVKSLIKCLNI